MSLMKPHSLARLDQSFALSKDWLKGMMAQQPHGVDMLIDLIDPERRGDGLLELGRDEAYYKNLAWAIANFACIGMAEVMLRIDQEEQEAADAAE